MKKYFSLIAVAMIAVSSVFTSCSKDDEGSSFCPQVTTESSVAANQATTQAAAADSTTSCSAGIAIYGYNDTNNQKASKQEVVSNMQSFFQAKVGNYATISVRSALIEFKVDKKNADKFNSIINSITNDEIKEVLKKTPAVNVVKVKMLDFTTALEWNITVNEEPDYSED